MRAVAFVLFFASPFLLPLAEANESRADCEKNQPWVGYASTDSARMTAENATQGSPAHARACEGEQWDGQDAGAGSCVVEAACLGADPNQGNADPLAGSSSPARLRAGVSEHGGAREAYVGFDVWLVSRGAVYVGHCSGGDGLERGASCAGANELRAGAYWRDNTPSNLIVNALSCSFSITGCFVGETDCDQATYQRDAYDFGPRSCGRDNTAFGADALLP